MAKWLTKPADSPIRQIQRVCRKRQLTRFNNFNKFVSCTRTTWLASSYVEVLNLLKLCVTSV